MFPACWRCKTTQLAMETRPEAEECTGDVNVVHDGKIGIIYLFIYFLHFLVLYMQFIKKLLFKIK